MRNPLSIYFLLFVLGLFFVSLLFNTLSFFHLNVEPVSEVASIIQEQAQTTLQHRAISPACPEPVVCAPCEKKATTSTIPPPQQLEQSIFQFGDETVRALQVPTKPYSIPTTRIQDNRNLQPWNRAPLDAEERVLEQILLEAASESPPYFPNTVILLLCNRGFHELLLNFLHFAHRTVPPITNYVIFPLDEDEYRNLSVLPYRYYYPKQGLDFSPRPRNFRSGPYNQIVSFKFHMAEKALALGFNPFVVDVDNVFVRNPFNFLTGFPVCDFTAVSDAIYGDKILLETENRWRGQGHDVYINTGFIYWRNTALILDIVQRVIAQSSKINTDDQDLFCRILDEYITQANTRVNVPHLQRHQSCSQLGPVTANILPPGLFGSQKIVLQTLELARVQMTPPYVIHFGHLSGFYEKRRFMNLTGYWNLTLP